MCAIAVKVLSDGHSMTGLAGKLKIGRNTIYEWRKRYPEFDEACTVGMAAAAYWWEQRLVDLAQTNKGNAAAVIFGLKNRASDDWRDRVEHTGADGGAIIVEITRFGDADPAAE